MLSENIKHFRKAKKLSQEEMAVKLNVVRQTVSKWESGLSVPDAEMLIHISELLEAPVSRLLGTDEQPEEQNLSEELERVNRQLSEKIQRETLLRQADSKRGLILAFSFLAMLIALSVKNPLVSVILAGLFMLSAALVLYRNLALLTSVTTNDLRIGTLRITTVFDILMLLVGIVFAVLTALDVITFSRHGEEMFATAVISCVMLFAGIISPKLPFTRHTGLRLPWTVRDEDTWNVAHRILGYISLPAALLYIACALTVPNFEAVTLCAMLIWLGIPSLFSLVFFYRKTRGD